MQTIHLSQLDPSAITNDCAGLVLGAQLKIGSQKRVWRCAYEEKAYVLKALILSGQPSRPNAITCCRFSSLKTLLMPT